MKKRRGWSGILILLLLLLCACGGEQESDISRSEESEISRPDTSRPAEESRSEEEPTSGGELALAVVNPNSLNPLLCMEEEAQQMLRLIFSPLLDRDAEGQAQPALAQSGQKEGNKLTLQLVRRIIADLDAERREWEFSALSPEDQRAELDRAQRAQNEWKEKIAELKRQLDWDDPQEQKEGVK